MSQDMKDVVFSAIQNIERKQLINNVSKSFNDQDSNPFNTQDRSLFNNSSTNQPDNKQSSQSSTNQSDNTQDRNLFNNPSIQYTPIIKIDASVTGQVASFWKNLSAEWNTLYSNIMKDDESARQVLRRIFELLGPLSLYVDIDISFNQINQQFLRSHMGLVTLYISPKLSPVNISVMKKLYEERATLPNMLVACYRPYHPRDEIKSEIDHPDLNIGPVSYTDFGYQGSFAISPEHNPALNMIIMIKQPLASKILQKETIKFKKPDGTVSSREVWLSKLKYNPLDEFLMETLGEYNIIHHVGLIEMFPEDDPLIRAEAFTELSDARIAMELILKHYNYNSCNYCQHHQLQTQLMTCMNCKKNNYCSRLCQKADWKNHKQFCKKV